MSRLTHYAPHISLGAGLVVAAILPIVDARMYIWNGAYIEAAYEISNMFALLLMGYWVRELEPRLCRWCGVRAHVITIDESFEENENTQRINEVA